MKEASCNEASSQNDTMKEIQKKPKTTSLLERLRRQLVVVDPTSDEEMMQKMNLAIDCQSEFPLKLREAIRDISGGGGESSEQQHRPPEVFLSDFFKATRAFFFGRSTRFDLDRDVEDDGGGNDNDEEEEEEESSPPFHWWYGLDRDIDTEEEVEVAIRFFPEMLNEKFSRTSSLIGCYPIYMLLMCSKALSFIPLFAELGIELGRFKEKERGGLICFMKNVFFHLICNVIIRDDLGEESSGKLDEVSSSVLMRLREKGLMKKEDIYQHDLTNLMLYREIYNSKKALRIDKRFRFLINWDPTILVECGRKNNLLYHYVHRLCSGVDDRGYRSASQMNSSARSDELLLSTTLNNTEQASQGGDPPSCLQRFKVIFELGMNHFPAELGFIFHRSTFKKACEKFGKQTVTQIINDEIFSAINNKKDNNNSQQSLVFAAATNQEISLDGVYTLLRRDPLALLPQPSTIG